MTAEEFAGKWRGILANPPQGVGAGQIDLDGQDEGQGA